MCLQRSIKSNFRARRARDVDQWRFERAHRLIVLRHAADAMQAERDHAGNSTLLNASRSAARHGAPIRADAAHRGRQRARQAIGPQILPLVFRIEQQAAISGGRGIKFVPSAGRLVHDLLQHNGFVFLCSRTETARYQP